MALKKNSPNISDEMSLLNEVPAFLKRETSPINPRGGKDWIMFPNDMPLVSQILGSEPIMVQSEEAEEPLTITPDDIRTWLTGTVESGSIGFITGDVLYNELSKYVPKTTKVNGQALTGDITITKGDIGLGNVDNTSDMNKPISNAVNNKFQELADTWGVDITQLKIDVNNIDQLLDKTVIEVNRLSEIIGELDTDFTGHLTDPDAHSNIRVNSMVDTTTNAKIPNVVAVRDFVTNYVSRLSEFTIPDYNNRYLYILNGANQQKISDTSLKNLLKMSTIYENIVTSPSQFPDPSTLTVGTIVRVGRFLGGIITDPYTSYSAKEGEILVFNGNTYEHFAYSENVHNFTILGSNDKLTLNLNDQAGTIGIDLPFVTNSTPGILSPADYEALISMSGLTKYGTPNSSWEIGYTTGDLIRLDKTSGGALDFIWNNPDNPIKTDAEGNRVPYYASVTLGDLVIKGNVTQEGSSFISKAETVEVKDNTLLLNKGETGAGVTKGTAGVEIDRGTLPRYQFLFDESDDRFKVGSVGDLWPVMIRDEEADLTDGGILTWDSTTKRAKTAFNIDDLADTYLPLAGGTMSGSIIMSDNTLLVLSPQTRIGLVSRDDNNRINGIIGRVGASLVFGDKSEDVTIDSKYDLFHRRFINNKYEAYRIWTEGNDGANSGLDADLLDGQHGSYYAKATDYIPLKGNSTTTPITGHLYTKDVLDWGIYGMKIEGADGLPRTAHIQFNASQTGAMGSEPAKSNAYTEMGSIGEVWGPNTVSQLRVGYEDNLPVLKYRNNPEGPEIKEYNIYHEGNLNISEFASVESLNKYLPKTGGSMSGNIIMDRGSVVITPRSHLSATFNGNPVYFILDVLSDTLLTFGNGHYDLRIISTNDLQHNVHDGNGNYTLYKIYDERNLDISTFALKTDLDNIDLSGYLPLSGGTMTGSIILPKNDDAQTGTVKGILGTPGWVTTPGDIPPDMILGYSQDMVALGNDGASLGLFGSAIVIMGKLDISLQAAAAIGISAAKDLVLAGVDMVTLQSDNKLYLHGENGVFDAHENKYWTAGNDGSGSGLDADLLDGKQGSEYALTSSLSGYLPLSGGKMSGPITMIAERYIIQEQNVTSNYTPSIRWAPGGTLDGSNIGRHNTGGDGTGAIVLVPYPTDKNSWERQVGLYIGKNELLLDGKPVALKENIPSLLPANGGTSTYSTYLKVNDLRASAIVPTYGEQEIIGWFNNLGTPGGNWWSGIHVKGWTSTYSAWQLAGPSDSIAPASDALWFRSGKDNAWNGWKRVAFINEVVTLDTTQTISGAKTFTSYTIFSAGSGISSDIRLKENLVILYDSEEVLRGIHGYRYKLKESGKDYAGLIAQEVQRVLPEAVVEGEDGFLTVDTYPIVAALVESNNIKTHRIEMLEKRLSELESKVGMLLSRI